MSISEIGCCAAYCGACRARKMCEGCRAGYAEGSRDIAHARCAIKVCCVIKGYTTCADCEEFENCCTLQNFYSKHGQKHTMYKKSAEFIRSRGYDAFLQAAQGWTGAYGALED